MLGAGVKAPRLEGLRLGVAIMGLSGLRVRILIVLKEWGTAGLGS